MFRRRASSAPDVLDSDPAGAQASDDPSASGDGPQRPGWTPAKGKPTPKRSEAEKRRRQPHSAPTDRKAASQKTKQQDRSARQAKVAAMRRGEEWALPRKDQGKVRGLARDYVDSRRSASEFYLFGVIALVLLLFIPGLRQTLLVDYIVLGVLAVILIEGWFTGRRVLRLVQQRFPAENTRGVRLYAAMRSTQLRKMRMPPPRVSLGDKI